MNDELGENGDGIGMFGGGRERGIGWEGLVGNEVIKNKICGMNWPESD